MQDAVAIAAALGRDGDDGFHVRPGIEMRAGGNITLSSTWNLLGWHFNGEPGYLTLRAGGDLNINSSISDAFPDFTQLLRTAGAGLLELSFDGRGRSRERLAVRGAARYRCGDLRLAADTHIRTGTGDIAIAAAGDIRLVNNGSVIYTSGAPIRIFRLP